LTQIKAIAGLIGLNCGTSGSALTGRNAMKNNNFKKLNTRSHFSDFWHRAKSWRDNKKIGARNERRKLNRECDDGERKEEDGTRN
jgi:hypothetical protein